MSDSIVAATEYDELLDSIKRTLAAGQLRAARAANNVLVETYWQIGRDIVHRQQEQSWGARVIEGLSAVLRTAHPDVRGLSARNLRYMVAPATRWPTGIVQCGVAQLPWSSVATLLDGCQDRDLGVLRRARRGRGMDPGRAAVDDREPVARAVTAHAHDLRPRGPAGRQGCGAGDRADPFVLDFLAADPVRERDLSKALTDNLARFLRELGTGFAFVGAEVPVQCGEREFFLDLLFYHCRLHR